MWSIVAAPPAEVPAVIAAAGARGCAAAIIITAGLGHGPRLARRDVRAGGACGRIEAGRSQLSWRHGPGGLNASFAARMPRAEILP